MCIRDSDYNFQFAKRFWNNRFQVIIGGKISTGNDVQQQDESFIDNISLEYRLDNSGTRYIKIFHDKNYESILDGEVIETGAGIVLHKKMQYMRELFIFKRNKTKPQDEDNDKKEINEKICRYRGYYLECLDIANLLEARYKGVM